MASGPFNFSVVPHLPPRLEALRELAYNLWWSWNRDAVALFRRLDPVLWEACGHNPARLLRQIKQSQLEAAAQNADLCQHLEDVAGQLHRYLGRGDRWFARECTDSGENLIAYFSAEFGFHESLPIYSGGLGILAGDHCKSASDLGLPFIGVGLLYRLGYFKQRINRDGWQESESIDWNFSELSITQARRAPEEAPIQVSVALPGRVVLANVWEVNIGRTRLFLLDTDLPENRDDDRRITYQLYGGDQEMRLRQEIVLGIGGVQALRALGLEPTVYHLNEGHAAFSGLERIRVLVREHGLQFHEALQAVAAAGVFTTHTPVPAGNDAFAPDLFSAYFAQYAADCGVPLETVLALGRFPGAGGDAPFSMTLLALRTTRQANGVSAIHGRVSRQMWQGLWPGLPAEEVPIGHITNGVHTQTWMAPELQQLFEHAGAVDWEDRVADPEFWRQSMSWQDSEFWQTHQKLKERLIEFVRKNLARHRTRAQRSAEEIRAAGSILDPSILTIGFARRFASYKRATLLFRDLDRLAAIVNHPTRPVQFVFAGKAHPADEEGKKLIQQIYKVSQMPAFRDRIVFVENYDIEVARYLYHGVDVWLNTPTRPLEASGTSGEKVAPNGALNCSVRDGWWDEAATGKNGWSIGEEITSPDPSFQEEFDTASLYSLLERQIAPLFYRLNGEGLPAEWITRVRASIESIGPVYNTTRMVQDYTHNFYLSAAAAGQRLVADNFARARALSAWKQKTRDAWSQVRIRDVRWHHPNTQRIVVGEALTVEASFYLGTLSAEEVAAQVYLREAGGSSIKIAMQPVEALPEGWHQFRGTVEAPESGSYQLNVRALPAHPDLTTPVEVRMVTWAE